MSTTPYALRNLGAQPALRDFWDRLLVTTIFSGVVLAFIVSVYTDLIVPWATAVERQGWEALAGRPSVWWLAMGLLLLTVRTILWLRYREAPSVTMAQAPMLTVIVPAYNEGEMVAKTIASVVAARYPHERLQVIAVDDGSKDDTWSHIERMAAQHPGLVTPIRFARNQGKRAALAAGFERARGTIVVTIDSDSLIEPQTLLAIVGPFANPRVGAVAGKVAVLNRESGLIARMMHVRFILSFDFLRSAQSTYGTVYCCPGALAAYRTDLIRKILPQWIEQRFMGAPCTIGEDRALTNDVLALGYDTVYQRNAVVHTIVPETYVKLSKMLLRWNRSYIREEWRFARIVWKRPPLARIAALVEQTITNVRLPVALLTLVLFVQAALADPQVVPRVLLAIGAAALLYNLHYLRAERSWSFLYGVMYAYFAFFALFWVFPYALITVRAKGWLTR